MKSDMEELGGIDLWKYIQAILKQGRSSAQSVNNDHDQIILSLTGLNLYLISQNNILCDDLKKM